MSSTAGADLDFERADFGGSNEAMTCSTCPEKVGDTYFQVNGQTVCADCHARVVESLDPAGGGRRFVAAVLLGFGGGLLGAIVWYAVAEIFTLEIGLIAILVGWLVGSGVKKGSEERGGLKYQVLAAAVTYVSICVTYVPPIVRAIATQNSSATVAASTGAAQAEPDAASAAALKDLPPSTVPDAAAVGGESSAPPEKSAVRGIFTIAMVFGIALAAPFLGGFSNIISILIIGFAMQQAWQMNRLRALDIKGPFRVAPLPRDVGRALPSSIASDDVSNA